MESNSSRKDAFWIWLDVMWVWPLMLLLGTFDWFYPNVGLKLLAKSSWVLFAGICQTWILVVADRKHRVRPKWFVPVLVGLSLASIFLLPYGLGKWEFDTLSDSFRLIRGWDYVDNCFLSFLMHAIYFGVIWMLTEDYGIGQVWSSSYSSYGVDSCTDYRKECPRQDQAWKGWPEISDSYYGHRGEFDINDEARRASEDIEQFHNAHPDADLSDHYYWDDVLDAETDGYV